MSAKENIILKNKNIGTKIAAQDYKKFNNECFVTNLVIQELFTVLGMITNDSNYIKYAYHMIKDNFIIIMNIK
ncbi:MAG: hypothetical protein BZ138_06870 [Methanosphaera sp. rholeuAM270]|nr:MAG: hypothetical protein BZ138_06870 [Methanosphaera sp. rholeuAM270]